MQTGASPANAIRASRTNTLHRQAECKTANPSDLHAAESCSSGDVHVRPSLTSADHPVDTAPGQAIARGAFAMIEVGLPKTGYAMGADFTIADAALFYVFFFWASKTNIALSPHCQTLFERLRARLVMHQMLREEGYR